MAKQWVIETIFSETGSEGQRGSGLSPSWKVAELGLELKSIHSKDDPLSPSAFLPVLFGDVSSSHVQPQKMMTGTCVLTELCPLYHIFGYRYCQGFW